MYVIIEAFAGPEEQGHECAQVDFIAGHNAGIVIDFTLGRGDNGEIIEDGELTMHAVVSRLGVNDTLQALETLIKSIKANAGEDVDGMNRIV